MMNPHNIVIMIVVGSQRGDSHEVLSSAERIALAEKLKRVGALRGLHFNLGTRHPTGSSPSAVAPTYTSAAIYHTARMMSRRMRGDSNVR